MSGRLELKAVGAGLHHYLEGSVVRTGATLDVLLANGTWLSGRFVDIRTRPPMLHIGLSDGSGDPPAPSEGIMQLPPNAILRWPAEDLG